LEEVSALLVHDQPADHERRIEGEIQDLARIPPRAHELLLREVEGQRLDRNRIVVRQGMVQIEADRLDLRELDVPIHEHAVASWNQMLSIPEGFDRGILLVRRALCYGHGRIVGDLTALRPLSTVAG